mmetsp:Transcript_31064/g.57401  ORF Transcript_31064/g.57401 Transcript_31064/m.57401 type:complete len:103 (-) Transcript_31064:154-462(-)
MTAAAVLRAFAPNEAPPDRDVPPAPGGIKTHGEADATSVCGATVGPAVGLFVELVGANVTVGLADVGLSVGKSVGARVDGTGVGGGVQKSEILVRQFSPPHG